MLSSLIEQRLVTECSRYIILKQIRCQCLSKSESDCCTLSSCCILYQTCYAMPHHTLVYDRKPRICNCGFHTLPSFMVIIFHIINAIEYVSLRLKERRDKHKHSHTLTCVCLYVVQFCVFHCWALYSCSSWISKTLFARRINQLLINLPSKSLCFAFNFFWRPSDPVDRWMHPNNCCNHLHIMHIYSVDLSVNAIQYTDWSDFHSKASLLNQMQIVIVFCVAIFHLSRWLNVAICLVFEMIGE